MNASSVAEGRACLARGDYEQAHYWFERALGENPDSRSALEGAGEARNALGRPQEALDAFRRLQALDARSAAAFHGEGEALKQLGRIREARRAFERAAALAPRMSTHHFALAQITRFTPGDPRLAPLEALAAEMATFPDPQRAELHFALAKAYDDLNHHAEAFRHLEAGNALRRKWLQYDESATLGLMRAMAAAFTPELTAKHRDVGHPSDLPVFIIGMPRSGTTLVEQVLASHPKVFGAGELMYLHQLLGQGHLGDDFPDGADALAGEAFHRFGGHYVTRLRADAPKAERVVDKLPANFILAGLIHLALPKARLIHLRRDPLDTCFSCYASLFSANIDYTYDLGELGRYYRAYEALMDHWHNVLPEGAMLDVSYEELVADFEPQARRIVAYCGLDWDDACLSFHQTKRPVTTASAFQVRQPLYATSVGRARPYEPWLGPLREALGRAP